MKYCSDVNFLCNTHNRYFNRFKIFTWVYCENFKSYDDEIKKLYEKLIVYDTDEVFEDEYYFRFSDGKLFKLTHYVSWGNHEEDWTLENNFYIEETTEKFCNHLPKIERDFI